MSARTFTPDVVHGDGSISFTLKRCCNGCGARLGDIAEQDIDEHGNLTDVRAECPNCAPVVALEQAGCRTWQLTERSFLTVMHQIDQTGVFTKGYTRGVGPEQKLTVVGLRVGERPGHVVAFWGDWIIRHPDGGFTVHKAPEAGDPR